MTAVVKTKFMVFTDNGCFSILPSQAFAAPLDAAFTVYVPEGSVVELDLTHPKKGSFIKVEPIRSTRKIQRIKKNPLRQSQELLSLLVL